MRIIYTIVFYLALPLLVLRLYWRGRKETGYRQNISERFGLVKPRSGNAPCIWLHAVSVGEHVAASPLIKRLRKMHPEWQWQITVTTAAGRKQALQLHPDLPISYLPYDIPQLWNTFIKRIRPSACLLFEAELWPNMLDACGKHKIATALLNARLSKRSADKYQKVLNIMQRGLGRLKVAAQSAHDAKQFSRIGIAHEQITVIGNIKQAFVPDTKKIHAGKTMRDSWHLKNNFIWLAASTHPGEEEIIIKAHQKLGEEVAGSILIIAPRHLPRLARIKQQLNQAGLSWQCKSSFDPSKTCEVIIWDCIGQLQSAYALTDVACVCGSFTNIGGHNVLEAAAINKPIIVGKYHRKIKSEIDKLKHKTAAFIANDTEQLADKLYELATNTEMRNLAGDNAYKVYKDNCNILAEYITWLSQNIFQLAQLSSNNSQGNIDG